MISGEDFENFLVDIHLANEFEILANSVGYSHIEWIVIKRYPYDYLLSIYSEKSGYRVVLDIGLIANTVLEYGFFTVSTENYNYKFVFDIDKFFILFKKNVSSKLTVINFDDFVEKALTLESVALDVGSSLTGKDDLRNSMMSLGATCKACHSLYRN